MSFPNSICASLTVFFMVVAFSGCGGSKVDVSTPVQVTDEMQRQAEASDKFITEQSKTKKAN